MTKEEIMGIAINKVKQVTQFPSKIEYGILIEGNNWAKEHPEFVPEDNWESSVNKKDGIRFTVYPNGDIGVYGIVLREEDGDVEEGMTTIPLRKVSDIPLRIADEIVMNYVRAGVERLIVRKELIPQDLEESAADMSEDIRWCGPEGLEVIHGFSVYPHYNGRGVTVALHQLCK